MLSKRVGNISASHYITTAAIIVSNVAIDFYDVVALTPYTRDPKMNQLEVHVTKYIAISCLLTNIASLSSATIQCKMFCTKIYLQN